MNSFLHSNPGAPNVLGIGNKHFASRSLIVVVQEASPLWPLGCWTHSTTHPLHKMSLSYWGHWAKHTSFMPSESLWVKECIPEQRSLSISIMAFCFLYSEASTSEDLPTQEKLPLPEQPAVESKASLWAHLWNANPPIQSPDSHHLLYLLSHCTSFFTYPNNPRARYQTSGGNSYTSEPAEIIQTSQSWACLPFLTCSFLQNHNKGSRPCFPLAPSIS